MSKLPDPEVRTLAAEVARLREEVRQLRLSSPYRGSGMAPNGQNGVIVDGDLIIDGNLDLNGAGTVSGTWQSEAFDGNLADGSPGTTGWAYDNNRAVLPEVVLRPGSIGNDSLTNPVVPQYVYDYTSNFALTNTMAHIRRTTITVPPGVTSAIVNVTARIYAVNSTAGLDYLYCQANVMGFNGLALPVAASASNGSAMNVSPFATTLYGLTSGSTFTIDIDGQAAFGGWAASASNQADVSGTILWFR